MFSFASGFVMVTIKISFCIPVVRKHQSHKGAPYSFLLWKHHLSTFYCFSQIGIPTVVKTFSVTWWETMPGAIVRQLIIMTWVHDIRSTAWTHTHTVCVKLAQCHQSRIWISCWRCLGCRRPLNKWNLKSMEKKCGFKPSYLPEGGDNEMAWALMVK